ncbi:MAG: DUF4430 domain-containing protein [Patescibacteria group bacterium]
MKNKKYYIFITVLALSLTFGCAHFALAKNTKYVVKKPIAKVKAIKIENLVTLDVLGSTYKVSIKDKDTAYDAMVGLQNNKNNNFSFRSKNYSSLGNFIYEINGIKGTPGRYWIYYINNKKATLGVSKYVLKSGDIISWKQEGI